MSGEDRPFFICAIFASLLLAALPLFHPPLLSFRHSLSGSNEDVTKMLRIWIAALAAAATCAAQTSDCEVRRFIFVSNHYRRALLLTLIPGSKHASPRCWQLSSARPLTATAMPTTTPPMSAVSSPSAGRDIRVCHDLRFIELVLNRSCSQPSANCRSRPVRISE